ncbi:3625_t:CDS:2 [Dentiscutata erythropus]|uniref:3625_t:CDS:1 n=1 Tax=Dentiscutata erythropus TaxID=1348616 RepID=A0A9N9B0W0_9GLOM|nr:3625_t:CDS:2 [Dentiscutata erythropus]
MTFIAAFLGWTLDAFDFYLLYHSASNLSFHFNLLYENFLIIINIISITAEFQMKPSDIATSITVTLLLCPVGALIFGILADKYGRKYPLIADIILYSVVELASGFAPNFHVFVALRAIFGIAMGGKWGLGAALAMETLPLECRGLFSEILQQGYPTGYLIAAIFYYAVIKTLGWRAMFWVGSFPALVVVYIRFFVPESKAWEKTRESRRSNTFNELKKVIKDHCLKIIHTTLLMASFGFASHGTQDLFPTFLKIQLLFSPEDIAITTVIANIGSIIGGTICGYLSQYLGRRKMVVISMIFAGAFLPLIAIPVNKSLVTFGAFAGACGILPAHLNELLPSRYRGTFPGLTYHLGILIASSSTQIEALLGEAFPKSGEQKHVNFMETEISPVEDIEVV